MTKLFIKHLLNQEEREQIVEILCTARSRQVEYLTPDQENSFKRTIEKLLFSD